MIRAIICDDELATHSIIRHFVETEKFPIQIVGSAEDGMKAVELIESLAPQLVFLDISMPRLDGFGVMSAVTGRLAKIIIMTGFNSFENAQQALRMGACDILSKPIASDQLRTAIIRAIGWEFTSNESVNQILEYIHAHYREPIELNTLSALTYSTPSHIARLFKKHTGTTIISYVHQVRIEDACRLLKVHRGSIQEIAFQVGYGSLNNFYKYFKKYTGQTPAQYTER